MTDASKSTGMPLPDALAGNFQDAVRWFNQLWSGSPEASAGARAGAGALPSMMMPTLDVKELEKRISDLRSVEQWLNLNLNLLRTTIQGLEMQRSSLMAWQAMGTPSAAPAAGGPSSAKSSGTAAPEAPTFQPAMWWAALQQQFAQMAASAAAQVASATSAQSAGREDASSAGEVPPNSAKPQPKTKASGTPRS